jgi:hypothetical protein
VKINEKKKHGIRVRFNEKKNIPMSTATPSSEAPQESREGDIADSILIPPTRRLEPEEVT